MPRTHRSYDEEFKRQAVELYLNSGKARRQIARELGVSDASLLKWQKDLFGGSAGQPRDSRQRDETLAVTDPEEMAKENEHLRRQRDILKKAASILAEDPQLGMR